MAKKVTPTSTGEKTPAVRARFHSPLLRHSAPNETEQAEDRIRERDLIEGLASARSSSEIEAFMNAMFYRMDARESRLLSEVRQLNRQVSAQGQQLRVLLSKVQEGVPISRPPSGRAAGAIDALREQLATVAAPNDVPPEAVRRQWVEDGVVVPSATLADAWQVSRQALDQARERMELAGLKVGHRFYYPASFLGLASNQVATVCRRLAAVDAVSKVIFWTRQHEALEGRAVAECLNTRKGTDMVLSLADGVSAELGQIAFEGTSSANVHGA